MIEQHGPRPVPPRRAWQLHLLLALLLGLVARPGAAAARSPGPGARIVSLSPALTEILFALGAGAQVVGVSDYCTGPEEALSRPRVGGALSIDSERIVSLRPDLLLTVGRGERLRRLAAAEQISFHALTLESVADVGRAVHEVGALVGREAAARRIAAHLHRRLAALRRRYAATAPVPTLLSLSRPAGRLAGLMTCNRTSFLSELLVIAGGRNCFAGAPYRYLTPGLERIVAAAPAAILELEPDGRTWAPGAHGRPVGARLRRRLIADWAPFTTLPAVRHRRIAVLTQPYLLHPSLHLPEIAAAMARALHPGVGTASTGGRQAASKEFHLARIETFLAHRHVLGPLDELGCGREGLLHLLQPFLVIGMHGGDVGRRGLKFRVNGGNTVEEGLEVSETVVDVADELVREVLELERRGGLVEGGVYRRLHTPQLCPPLLWKVFTGAGPGHLSGNRDARQGGAGCELLEEPLLGLGLGAQGRNPRHQSLHGVTEEEAELIEFGTPLGVLIRTATGKLIQDLVKLA